MLPSDRSTAPSGMGVSGPPGVGGWFGCLSAGDGEGDEGEVDGEFEDGVSRKSS